MECSTRFWSARLPIFCETSHSPAIVATIPPSTLSTSGVQGLSQRLCIRLCQMWLLSNTENVIKNSRHICSSSATWAQPQRHNKNQLYKHPAACLCRGACWAQLVRSTRSWTASLPICGRPLQWTNTPFTGACCTTRAMQIGSGKPLSRSRFRQQFGGQRCSWFATEHLCQPNCWRKRLLDNGLLLLIWSNYLRYASVTCSLMRNHRHVVESHAKTGPQHSCAWSCAWSCSWVVSPCVIWNLLS